MYICSIQIHIVLYLMRGGAWGFKSKIRPPYPQRVVKGD